MKLSNKLFIIPFLAVISMLEGCASSEEVIQNLRGKSDRALCMEYMTLPTANFYHSEREYVINERRLDCWKYGNITEERRKADANLQRGLQPQQAAPQQIIIQQQSNPNACIQDGGAIFCPNYKR